MEMILDWFDGFSKGDINSLSYRQLLIDFFAKKIMIYDDKILIFVNYENETKDAEPLCILCSDLTSAGTPCANRTHNSSEAVYCVSLSVSEPSLPIVAHLALEV